MLKDRLSIAGARYYHTVKQVQPSPEYNEKIFVAAEVEVANVNVDEPTSEDVVR